MKRGVVNLTKNEYEKLYLEVSQSLPLNLKNKSFQKNTIKKEETFQFSENEVETILDCLPAPFEINDDCLKQTRIKLQNFLTKLRFG
jgi:hypothetical protein